MINNEILAYIKGQLEKGVHLDQVKNDLVTKGGWTLPDVDEAFRVILLNKNQSSTPPAPAPAPSPINQPIQYEVTNKIIPEPKNLHLDTEKTLRTVSKTNFSKFVIIFLAIAVLFAGGYFIYTKMNPDITTSGPGLITDQSLVPSNTESNSSSQNDVQPTQEQIPQQPVTSLPGDSSLIQTKNIKLLNIKEGARIETGTTLQIKYELTSNIANALIVIGTTGGVTGCTESIVNKAKGNYSFSCNIPSDRIGDGSIGILDLSSSVSNPDESSGKYEVIAPATAKPVAITYQPELLMSILYYNSSYIAVSVKYSDGITRGIPFSFLTYSLDDPSLVTFKPLGQEISLENFTQHYTANKPGKTVLHLKYDNLSKDIPIQVCSPSSKDFPC